MIEIFKNSIYRILWTSLITSIIGWNIGYLAILTILNDIYRKEIAVAYYYAMYSVVPIFMSYFVMVVVDKYDQRWIRLIASVLGTFVTVGLLFAYYYKLIWLFYLVGGIKAAVTSFATPAYNAYISKVIDKKDLIHANTIDSITINGLSILMQGIGGIVVKYIGAPRAFMISLGTYLLSDLILSSLIWYPKFNKIFKESKGQKKMDKNKGKTQMQLFREGLRYMKTTPFIFHLIIIKSIVNFGLGTMINLSYFYGFYKMTEFGSAAMTIGIVGIISSSYGIVNSYVFNKLVKNSTKRMTIAIIANAFIMTAGNILYSFAPNIYFWTVGDALLLAGNLVIYDMLTTIIQKRVPDEVQGRVMSIGYNLRIFMSGLGTITTGIVITYYKDYLFWFSIGSVIFVGLSVPYSIYAYIRNRKFVNSDPKNEDEINEDEEPLLSGIDSEENVNSINSVPQEYDK